MLYTGKEITNKIYSHFIVSELTGAVTEKFGWTNNGIDTLRRAMHESISIIRGRAKKYAERCETELHKHQRAFFKTQSMKEKIQVALNDTYQATKNLCVLNDLIDRISDGGNVHVDAYRVYIDSLVEDCRKWVVMDLIDLDKEYEVNGELLSWTNPRKYMYLVVEVGGIPSLITYRFGADWYRNEKDGSITVGYLAQPDEPHELRIIKHVTWNGANWVAPGYHGSTVVFIEDKDEVIASLKDTMYKKWIEMDKVLADTLTKAEEVAA